MLTYYCSQVVFPAHPCSESSSECRFGGPLPRAASRGLQVRGALPLTQWQSSTTLFKGLLSRGQSQRRCPEVFSQMPRLQKMKSPSGNFCVSKDYHSHEMQNYNVTSRVLLTAFHKRKPAFIEHQFLACMHLFPPFSIFFPIWK